MNAQDLHDALVDAIDCVNGADQLVKAGSRPAAVHFAFEGLCRVLRSAWKTIPRVECQLILGSDKPVQDGGMECTTAHTLALRHATRLWCAACKVHPSLWMPGQWFCWTRNPEDIRLDPGPIGNFAGDVARRVSEIPIVNSERLIALITIEGVRASPTAIQSAAATLTPCENAVMQVLKSQGARMTKRQICRKMAENGEIYGDSTLRKALSSLAERGLIETPNRTGRGSDGYGLPRSLCRGTQHSATT